MDRPFNLNKDNLMGCIVSWGSNHIARMQRDVAMTWSVSTDYRRTMAAGGGDGARGSRRADHCTFHLRCGWLVLGDDGVDVLMVT